MDRPFIFKDIEQMTIVELKESQRRAEWCNKKLDTILEKEFKYNIVHLPIITGIGNIFCEFDEVNAITISMSFEDIRELPEILKHYASDCEKRRSLLEEEKKKNTDKIDDSHFYLDEE